MNETEQPGITLIILTYHRPKGLKNLLESLAEQDLAGLKLEVIICNNAQEDTIHPSRFTSLGRALRLHPESRIINSRHNWRTDIRYALALLGQHDTILFLDDDMILQDADFITYFYESFKSIEPFDILTGWGEFWKTWDTEKLEIVSFNFNRRGINDLLRCDVCGPGISMFSRQLLHSQQVFEGVTSPVGFPKADDMALGPLAWLAWGSTVYYLPSYGKVSFDMKLALSDEAMYFAPDHNRQLYAFYKKLVADGYQPVMQRLADMPGHTSLPEVKYSQSLSGKRFEW